MLLLCATAFGAAAQDTPGERPQIESEKLPAVANVQRTFSASYPAGDEPRLFLGNQIGAVRVSGWDNPVISVEATINVGARDRAAADLFAQQTVIAARNSEEGVEVRTRYPETSVDSAVGYYTDYEVHVPRGTRVALSNALGPTAVDGIGGDVLVKAEYSPIDLKNLTGNVVVHARNEALNVENVRIGVFTLRLTDASFRGVQDALTVDSYLGEVHLNDVPEGLTADIRSDSGPVYVSFTGAVPSFDFTARFAEIRSDMPLEQKRWGEASHAAFENTEMAGRVRIESLYESIHLTRKAPVDEEVFTALPGSQVVTNGVESHTYHVAPDTRLTVQAAVGNVTVTSVEGDYMTIGVTKHVRVQNPANARTAMERLVVQISEFEGEYLVESRIDPDSVDPGESRIDLTIQCPTYVPIHLKVERGVTRCIRLHAPLRIEQAAGDVYLGQINAAATLAIQEGGIEAVDLAGPSDLQTENGGIRALRPAGALRVAAAEGDIVIDSPEAGVDATTRTGDIRIIALAGVGGAYTITAENGNINLALPNGVDAAVELNVNDGTYYSNVPLSGTSQGRYHTMTGRLNAATHRIALTTHQGNIAID